MIPFVISLEKSKHRIALFESNFKEYGPYQIVTAVDGEQVEKKYTGPLVFVKDFDGFQLKSMVPYNLIYNNRKFVCNPSKRIKSGPMRSGEIGCALSHRLLYERLVQSDTSCFFIVEDDICPNVTPSVWKEYITNLPVEFDLIQLCTSMWYPYEQTTPVNSYYSNIKRKVFNGTMSYIISKSCALRLLNDLENEMNNAADDILSQAFIRGRINVIVPNIPLVRLSDVPSTIF